MVPSILRAAPALALAVPLLVAGCAESSGGGGAAAATAGSGTTAPGSTASGIPAAPASVGSPLDAYNAELQKVWDAVRPMVKARLDQEAATQLAGVRHSTSAVDVEVVNVRALQLDAAVAPGFTQLDADRLALRAPLQGSWLVALEADVRVRVKIGSFSPAVDLPLRLELSDLSLEASVELDTADPTRPTLSRVGRPQVSFQVALSSSNPLVAQLTNVLSPVADWLAHRLLDGVLSGVLPSLSNMQGMPGPVPGDGAPALQDSGTPTPFEELAVNIDRKIRRHHLPHGTLLLAHVDQPSVTSWLDAYRDGGVGMEGAVVDYDGGGDSAIWTGHYLAAQAFRYSVTGESEALDNVAHVIGGIGALLDVNGGTGLLARNAAPDASLVGQTLNRRGTFGSATINGEAWVGYQGSYGISRDQYSGVFFGLAIAYELIPQVRADCARRIEQMLDYLLANDWIIEEDRPTWNGSNSSRGPTFWMGVNYQKLAFLLIGHRMNPSKYAAELAAAGPLAETAWSGLWMNTFGIDHYYKFNLSHIGLYNYFRLETDPHRWQAVHRGYRILERYVGHHRDVHFDLIQTSIDPHTQTELFPQTREQLRRFLRLPHRDATGPVVDLSSVQWVTVTQTSYAYTTGQSGGNSGLALVTTSVQMPSEPLDLDQRRPAGDFLWQRDPFQPGQPNEGNPRREKHGLDYSLPYWMGRYYGAF